MLMRGMFHWHNILLAVLLAAIAADIAFGLDAVLNLISTAAMVVFILFAALLFAAAAIIVLWISTRNLLEDIRSDSRSAVAWRWKILALVGGAGLLIDGAVGAWNAFQQHILFSVAVEEIPFSGVPVFLLLASYPVKWIEQYLEARNRKPILFGRKQEG